MNKRMKKKLDTCRTLSSKQKVKKQALMLKQLNEDYKVVCEKNEGLANAVLEHVETIKVVCKKLSGLYIEMDSLKGQLQSAQDHIKALESVQASTERAEQAKNPWWKKVFGNG